MWLLTTACAGSPTADLPSGDTSESTTTTTTTSETPTCTPSVELGTGIDAFESLSTGDPLVMVFGPQGGFHLPLAVRGCSLSKVARTTVQATQITSKDLVVDVTLDHTWRPEDDCCSVLLDLQGFLFFDGDPDFWPPRLDGTEVHIAIQVVEEGRVHTDEVEVVVLAPKPSE